MSKIEVQVWVEELGMRVSLGTTTEQETAFIQQFDTQGKAIAQAVRELSDRIASAICEKYDRMDAQVDQRLHSIGASTEGAR